MRKLYIESNFIFFINGGGNIIKLFLSHHPLIYVLTNPNTHFYSTHFLTHTNKLLSTTINKLDKMSDLARFIPEYPKRNTILTRK